ncbi:single-stranded DNA-specific exonuclease [Thiohalobacter thiocyanaticus]|uniref:Single-stranded DNA-specific exonuclease n=1 Tax=Thiohalobacter thiocyanaticus TaxID=585455 RepID=A0A1Z4VRF4_9GAMM|nr:hypothetical protein [Thiohalobacter thiocyanaticus]BAZ94063.1 single-stranded DNA-specific exonuclease [Thiohalobacter thiocyanaticus]
MSPESVLVELLGRVGAQNGAAILISDHELNGWPAEAVKAMTNSGLMKKARPATSVACPGCERECIMPVHVLTNPGNDPRAFIVCDKRSDINRVPVPAGDLAQWQVSAESIAAVVANLLDLHRSGTGDTDAARWEVGLLKGKKHASHVVLTTEGALTLNLAGHSIELTEVLTLEGNNFKVDKRRLTRLVDQPVAGAGDTESATQRRERLKRRVDELKAKGVKAFLKTVAEEEGISVTRVKQLLQEETEPKKPSLGW